jgi:hypothetical protein
MTEAAQVIAVVVAVLSAAAGVVGGWAWHRGTASRAFWPLLRASQAAAVVQAAVAGVLAVAGPPPADGLYYLYALLPLAVGLVAEQLRLVAAEQVLENRGLAGAREVGELPEVEQRSVVHAILRREMGVMALGALVVCFLALRALGTL